ncbi:MAG: hypothetical protein O2905_05940 [Proteobacteria bacterium]|nr:hypothetical protein [Pseudomonadota bacterium]
MPELFILIAFMVATLVLLGGLMVIFRGWMAARDRIPSDSAGRRTGGH